MRLNLIVVVAVATVLAGCGGEGQDSPAQLSGSSNSGSSGGLMPIKRTFAQDVDFLNTHVTVIELTTGDGPAVAVVPEYQGRVMTSTFDATNGYGNGWINYDLIESGEVKKQFNPFGGEDRLWLGPEGGQFSLFFDKDTVPDDGSVKFDIKYWQTPLFVDTETFDIVSQTETEVVFTKDATVKNYSGTEFTLGIERGVKIFTNEDIESQLGIELPATVQSVAYESRNMLTNKGEEDWKKETGLLSIWVLGMYKPSATMRIIVPYDTGGEGLKIKDDYFGVVPENRLVTMDGYSVFRADGQRRSKIGIGPGRAKDVVGSYDSDRRILTIVKYNLQKDVTDYVNSSWDKHQLEPYGGDIVNCYNDGPQDDGTVMGPFCELETSSPALALKAGESYEHFHRTFHFTGTAAELSAIALEVLGVDLDEAVAALK